MIKNSFRNLAKDKVGLRYTAASMFSSIVSMFVGVIIIRWINPSELGLWQSISILQVYVPFLEGGVVNGLNRELPFLVGRKKKKLSSLYNRTGQYYMVLIALIFLIITCVVTGTLLFLNYEMKIIAGIFTVGCLVTLNCYQRYLVVTFRSTDSFQVLSKLYIYQALAQLLLLPIVVSFEYYGLLLYTLLVLFWFTLIMHLNRPFRESPIFIKPFFFHLVKVGLPVFISGYLRGVSNSFTRIVLLLMSGTMAVGLFTPVNAVLALISVVPGILGNYYFPKMNYTLGSTNDAYQLWPIISRINAIIVVFAVPFIILVWIVAPPLLMQFFPNYLSAEYAIKITSLNFLFAGTLITHNAIYSIKNYTWGYFFVGSELLLRFTCPYLMIRMFDGNVLTLTAIGILISNILLFVVNLFLLLNSLQRKVSLA
ncbi:MAG: lipopolysaccharide biosynthesis protein [Cyclobacteriaceae bacterium]